MARSTTSRHQSLTAPTRHLYDVIVVGGQLGGALAAGLLAKRGYQVLYVEHEGAERAYTHQGWRLPTAPFLLPQLKSMPGVDAALTELGVSQSLSRLIRARGPALQLLLPNARVDLHEESAPRARELTRVFGEVLAGELDGRLTRLAGQHELSDPFFKEPRPLPPEGWLERLALKRQANAVPGLETAPALGAEHPSELLLASLIDFASLLEDTAAPLARTRILAQLARGGALLPGGREAFRDLLLRRLSELGADVLGRSGGEPILVEHLAFGGGKLEGIKLLNNDQVYRADLVLGAMDGEGLRRLLPEKKKQRRLAEELDAATPKSFLLGVTWMLPERALPRGLGDLALLDPGPHGPGPLLIEVLEAQNAVGEIDQATRMVSASTRVPVSALELGEEHLNGWITRVEAALDALMPFSRAHLLSRSVPILDAPGARAGRLPHPHFAFEEPPALGVGGVAQRTGTKQLILANREILPGLGVEGELLAGVRAARLVQERLKREPSLRRS